MLGVFDGVELGTIDGCMLGLDVIGERLGSYDGSADVGDMLGVFDGASDEGDMLGVFDGASDEGDMLGVFDGASDEGDMLGIFDGVELGTLDGCMLGLDVIGERLGAYDGAADDEEVHGQIRSLPGNVALQRVMPFCHSCGSSLLQNVHTGYSVSKKPQLKSGLSP